MTISLKTQALILGVICGVLYFLGRTPALDEWDSVQFAFGVGDFNLWRHHPHPPGYPVYIAFGWAAGKLFHLDAQNALQLGSAVGGGLFIGCWFVLLRRRFDAFVTWCAILTLAGLLVTWMSATKVLTDPLGAGLLGLTLLLADTYRRDPQNARRALAGSALAGAIAVGTRPQNFAVVLFIMCLTIGFRRGKPRDWALGIGVFLASCLLWLLPTMWLQAHVPESGGNPWAYVDQLTNQWRWRFNQPKVFLAASGQSRHLLNERLGRHFVDWLLRGFGFSPEKIRGWLGIALMALGWTFHVLEMRRPGMANSPGRAFWREHLPWAVAYIAMVFCCLPGDQRYYLPIYPLLILAAVAGWRSLPGQAGWTAALVPVMAIITAQPYIRMNHAELPPPVHMMHFLQARHPAEQRAKVWLILRDDYRHAQWYNPEFHLLWGETFDPNHWPEGWQQADAIYTDDPALAKRPPAGRKWALVRSFKRSTLIYRKHSWALLYRLRTVDE
jgi:hypothetical protein